MGLGRLAAVFATSGVLTGIYWTHRERFTLQKANARGLDEALEEYKKGIHRWNWNWDHRAPKPTDETDGGGGDEKKVAKSKARRHLFLIRHGQYEMWHKDSKLKKLTELGRQQAKETGERLRLLDHDYSILYFSTLPRATETAGIIRLVVPATLECVIQSWFYIYSESLPQVPTEKCDLLREGAPYPPDPPSKNWRPEYNVTT